MFMNELCLFGRGLRFLSKVSKSTRHNRQETTTSEPWHVLCSVSFTRKRNARTHTHLLWSCRSGKRIDDDDGNGGDGEDDGRDK